MLRRRPPFFSGPRLSRRRQKQLIILGLLFFGLLGGGGYLRGKIISVPDGDTVVLLTHDLQRQRIRLYGIDCPELGQRGGEAAREYAASLALFEPVTVTVVDRDRYKRDVAVITLADGSVLNEHLLRAGHAWIYNAYCDAPFCPAWRKQERAAREQRLGLWQEDAPLPPWTWRKRQRRGK